MELKCEEIKLHALEASDENKKNMAGKTITQTIKQHATQTLLYAQHLSMSETLKITPPWRSWPPQRRSMLTITTTTTTDCCPVNSACEGHLTQRYYQS